MDRFEGKRIFVTGAAGGIGLGIACAFLGEGGRVVLADFRAEALERAQASLSPTQRERVSLSALDVRSQTEVDAAIGEAWRRLDGLDILVNAAGIYPSHPLLEMREEDWDRVLDTNVKGPLFTSQAFARRLIAEGRPGHIVNITSGAAERTRPGAAHYCSSKAALAMLTRSFAIELAAHGIRVNAVSPGFVNVPGEVSPLSEQYVAAISRGIPLGRSGEPQDIAGAVLFSCSDAAAWMTGSTLRIDGGASAGNALLPLSQP